MQLFDPNNPNEKKKMIVAAVLAVGALLVLGYLFLGGGSTKPTTRATASPTPTPARGPNKPPPEDEDISVYQEIVYNGTVVGAPEADRNIFAYYVAPTPPPRPIPTPTPTPTPPLNVSTVSPASVFARTGDFSLQVMGDKFAPGVRIVIDGRAMPTRIISTQQVATTVTADMIANPGTRRIEVRTADGALYSNVVNLNVTAPPDPRNSFSYIGLIGKPRGNDIAVLQDKNNKELVNAQRGDLVGGRFRLTSISDKELKLVDVNLKIPHTLAFTPDTSTGGRPPVRRPVVDDDPEL
jgi:hypothetical protein